MRQIHRAMLLTSVTELQNEIEHRRYRLGQVKAEATNIKLESGFEDKILDEIKQLEKRISALNEAD